LREAIPRQSKGMGVFSGTGALVSAHYQLLGDGRQAGRDAAAAADNANRRVWKGEEVGPALAQEEKEIKRSSRQCFLSSRGRGRGSTRPLIHDASHDGIAVEVLSRGIAIPC